MNLRKTFNAQRPTLNVQRRMLDVERYLAGSWSQCMRKTVGKSKQIFSDPANPISSRLFPGSSQENGVSSQFSGAVALPGGP